MGCSRRVSCLSPTQRLRSRFFARRSGSVWQRRMRSVKCSRNLPVELPRAASNCLGAISLWLGFRDRSQLRKSRKGERRIVGEVALLSLRIYSQLKKVERTFGGGWHVSK